MCDLVCVKGMDRAIPSLSSSLGTVSAVIFKMYNRQNLEEDWYNNSYYILKIIYVVVQFYPQFKFYFPLFWGLIMCGNELKTKGNKN